MTCARCTELEEQIAYLKDELGELDHLDIYAAMRERHGLTRQAVDVLQVLYLAKGRVVDKLRIQERIRSKGESDKIIDVQLVRIRHALGRRSVITEWGNGYRIGAEGVAALDAVRADGLLARAALKADGEGWG